MKKTIILAAATLLAFSTTRAQRSTIDLYHGTLSGINYSLPNGFGLGFSYYLSTYTGTDGSKEVEVANKQLPFEPAEWGKQLMGSVTGRFIENRATAKIIYSLPIGERLELAINTGIAFRTEYVTASSIFSPIPSDNFFVFRHIAPKFLYGVGGRVSLIGNLGINVLYNNIEGFAGGLTFKL